jgi:hypothetical protein
MKIQFNRADWKKKHTVIAVCLLVLSVSIGMWFLSTHGTRPPHQDELIINEPDAPVSQDLKSNTFSITSGNGLKADELIKNKTASVLAVSSGGKHLYIYNANPVTQSSFDLFPKVQAATLDEIQTGGNLIVTNTENVVIKVIENANVLSAEFVNDDLVVYQKSSEYDYGIFFYTISTDTKQKIIETADPSVMQNLAFLDNENYFFIQPATGEIGFGNLGKGITSVLDVKALQLNSHYAAEGAYQFATISPDKQYLAFYDLSPTAKGMVHLIIIPATAKNLSSPYWQVELTPPAYTLRAGEKYFSWSGDGKYLVTADGTMLNLAQKTLVTNQSSGSTFIRVSPDSTRFAGIGMSQFSAFLQPIAGGTQTKIADGVTQMEWIGNSKLILVIGKRLYTYDANNSQLFSVSTDQADYLILAVNPAIQTAWVKKGEQILQISLTQ